MCRHCNNDTPPIVIACGIALAFTVSIWMAYGIGGLGEFRDGYQLGYAESKAGIESRYAIRKNP